MSRSSILVVEDDGAIREGLVDVLNFEGFEVVEAADAPAGLEAAKRLSCDLVLLDLMLPGGDGFSVLEELRKTRPTLPVIILTAKGQEGDRVRGLKLGADDYVVKPFGVKELLARIEAVLRRSPARTASPGQDAFPGGSFDRNTNQLVFADKTTEDLAEREAELLNYFLQNIGRTLSRDELIQKRLAPQTKTYADTHSRYACR